MIIYFLLIGFASLLMGVEFLIDTHGPELKEKLVSNFEKNSNFLVDGQISRMLNNLNRHKEY